MAKPRMVSAILINPYVMLENPQLVQSFDTFFEHAVTEVQHDATDYREIYKHLTQPNVHPVDLFDAVTFNEHGDAVYVDDEGLYKASAFFRFKGLKHTPLAGRGLILGVNSRGNTVSPKTTVDWVRENVEIAFHRSSVTFNTELQKVEGAIHPGPAVLEWAKEADSLRA